MAEAQPAIGADAVVTLRRIALDGGLAGETKLSCSGLAGDLDVSTQTASRRLQHLEEAGLIERETVGDGQWVSITDAGERALRREYESYRRVFEEPEVIELRGAVTSGMGEGRHYISLSGYMAQFRERLGYEPFPGTLNLDLDTESVRTRMGLSGFEPIPIDGWEDEERTYGPAVCYPASVTTTDGDAYDETHVIAPERTHHDEDQLELIAPVKLRDELNLADGNVLMVSVEESG